MDDRVIQSGFDSLNTKFDSLNIEIQNNNITIKQMSSDITEIKSNILQNCKKLDGLSNDIKEIKELLRKD